MPPESLPEGGPPGGPLGGPPGGPLELARLNDARLGAHLREHTLWKLPENNQKPEGNTKEGNGRWQQQQQQQQQLQQQQQQSSRCSGCA
ncbi:hypothetical protein Emed_002381 [Eimeria media]